MDLSDADMAQRDLAARREVVPPIQVETATWSRAGQLDWWVKDWQQWWVGYAALTVVNGGSELLIFAHDCRSVGDYLGARSTLDDRLDLSEGTDGRPLPRSLHKQSGWSMRPC